MADATKDGDRPERQPYAYRVYVILLDAAVRERKRFLAANPNARSDGLCAYVGHTVRTADERFDQHKRGVKANRYVRDFGVRLLTDPSWATGPFASHVEAAATEADLARRLRAEGWFVWTN